MKSAFLMIIASNRFVVIFAFSGKNYDKTTLNHRSDVN
jgi:hypothetical protein